jgi:hypothetical protein
VRQREAAASTSEFPGSSTFALASTGERGYKSARLWIFFFEELTMGKGNNSHRKEVKKKKAKKDKPKASSR